ncbi:MAG TPA: polysaccharide biosynthesis/export family protein [Acidobacteriaceae bacterium]|nr:polysaccharide biosynthesis/export family protein [Acidobacteriaceae bacterium]
MAILLAQGGFLMFALRSMTMARRFCPGVARLAAGIVPLVLVVALLWPAAAAYAQFQGPAPTKADSPNPDNKGLVERAPTEVMPGGPIVLHPGDGINVSVYGVPDYKITARIAGDGNVDLPLIGSTHVAGLTVEQAQQLVAKKLIDGQMILSPDVLISVTDSNVDIIGVMGEVNSPRAIPAFAPMSLFDALSAAGGLKPDASHSISILRKGVNEPLLVVLNSNPANAVDQNIPLYPGDRVIVPRTGVVYVVGAVIHSGAYPITPDTPLTLTQAVTLAGNTGFQAAPTETRIIRTTGAKRREIRVNLSRVIAGKDPDPILQNDDIVMVPTNLIKAAIKGGGVGIAIGLVYAIPLL